MSVQDAPHRVSDDFVNGSIFILGTILVFSPWYFRYADQQAVAWNGWLGGGFILIIALLATSRNRDWEQYAMLAAGCWLAISPWALDYADVVPATWTHLCLGSIVALLSVVELWRLDRPRLPRRS